MAKPKTMLAPHLQFEDANFRVPSDGWVNKSDPNGQEYLEAPTGDIWELINCKDHPELNGQQLFTWDAAMRETKRAGKRMPKDEEFDDLFITGKDMPNLVLAGYRDTGGYFSLVGSNGYLWTSSQCGTYVWGRFLSSREGRVYRYAGDKLNGLFVRCLKG